jgi:hypothetical protein
MARRQFTTWHRLDAPYGHASYMVQDNVLTLNSSLGRRQAKLEDEAPEELAHILLDELARERD